MTEHNQQQHSSEGYERRDIDIRKVLIVSAICIVFVVVSVILLDEYFTFYKERVYYDTALVPLAQDYLALQAEEDSLLTHYTRVDSLDGVYRIPIEKAMELVAEDSGS